MFSSRKHPLAVGVMERCTYWVSVWPFVMYNIAPTGRHYIIKYCVLKIC